MKQLGRIIYFSSWMLGLFLCASVMAEALAYKKPSPDEIKKKLTPLQYDVTQKQGTEPPYHNEYYNNHEAGIYVDRVSGEPLFSSLDKYESGTGWPSFTRPLVKENLVEKTDRDLFMTRTEVRSKIADSHLGHVFDDGPKPTGLRYCMNSASLRFIPVDKLAQEGYAQFLPLFEDKKAVKLSKDAKASSKEEIKSEIAIFAGGCFWSMQKAFDHVPGVESTLVGYTGGIKENPSYRDVSTGKTGHVEAVQVTYDPKAVSYEDLLKVFWLNEDPTNATGQFCDEGSEYRSQIFYSNEKQKALAEKSFGEMKKKFGDKLVTQIFKAAPFYAAEDYHQSYYKKNPSDYQSYRIGCGRDKRTELIWGKGSVK